MGARASRRGRETLFDSGDRPRAAGGCATLLCPRPARGDVGRSTHLSLPSLLSVTDGNASLREAAEGSLKAGSAGGWANLAPNLRKTPRARPGRMLWPVTDQP